MGHLCDCLGHKGINGCHLRRILLGRKTLLPRFILLANTATRLRAPPKEDVMRNTNEALL